MIVLVVVALAVRLPGLNTGLWADEVYSMMESFRTPFPETLSVFPGDNKHPLYALLAHASLSAFGESIWSVRLPALLFGVATVPLLYLLGLRLTSRVEAGVTATLLALSYHHVWFSQNARGYSALAFFAVLTTLLFLRATATGGLGQWAWYGVTAGLGAYTHLTFVFVVVAQAIVATLGVLGWPRGERRVAWAPAFAGFALSALVALGLYLPMLSQVVDFFLHRESNLKGVSSPTWALGEAIRVLRVGFGGAFGLGVAVLGLGAVVGLAGALSYARRSGRTFLLLTLPAMVTVLGAFAARGTMYPRFFFPLAGFALLIGVRGTFVAGGWVARMARGDEASQRRLGAVVAGAVVLVSALSLPLNWRTPKQDFPGAMAYAEGAASPRDVIAVTDVTAVIYGQYYRRTWRSILGVRDLEVIRTGDRDAGAPGQRVWLLYTFPRYLEKFDAPLAAYVKRECRDDRLRRFPGTVGDGDLLVCRLEPT